ncbi:MAG: PAS domain-containing sensor histidine kinase, partial [Chitinophagaceae bacterium]
DKLLNNISRTSADILVIIHIRTKETLFQSRSVAESLGYSKKNAPDLFTLLHPDDLQPMLDHVDNMVTAVKGEVREIEYRLRKPDNGYRIFRDRNTVYKWDDEGVPVEKLGIAQDITSELNAVAEVRKLNLILTLKNRELTSVNAELTTFNNIAAKDYAKTLRTLYMNLEYVASNDADQLPQKIKTNLRKAQSAIQKLKLLTDDIIAYSRIPQLESESTLTNLEEIRDEVVGELAKSTPDAVATVSSHKLPSIQGYPLLLSVLFSHLLSNLFTAEDRNVEISYDRVPGSKLLFPDMLDIDYHKIIFSSTGIKLEPEDAEKIFTLFHMLRERKKPGSIGLAVCRKIMQLHQGFINAVPLKSGIAFLCYFPVMTF